MVAFSKLFPSKSSYTTSELCFVNGNLQFSIPVSKINEVSEYERQQLILPDFSWVGGTEHLKEKGTHGDGDDSVEVVQVQDIEVVSVEQPKKRRGAPRRAMSEELARKINANPKYPKMNTNCQTSYRYYMRVKHEEPTKYKEMLLHGRMRSQIKSWRDQEAKLLKEKRGFELELQDLKDKKATKTEQRKVISKINTRKRKLDYRKPIMKLYDDEGSSAAIEKKRRLEDGTDQQILNESPQNMVQNEDVSESLISDLKRMLALKEQQYRVALAVMAEQAKNQARLEAQIRRKEEMMDELARVLIPMNGSLCDLKKELKQSQLLNKEYVEVISSLRMDSFNQTIQHGVEKRRFENEKVMVLLEVAKQNALLLEKGAEIAELESKLANNELHQRKIFDMESAYKAQKDILQGTIEELEKDLQQERDHFKHMKYLYCTVTGRPCTDLPHEDEDMHVMFDDGQGSHAFDEWKNVSTSNPEQDRTVVYEVIKAAKNGNTDAFKKHFDTEFVVPDDDEVAQLTDAEKKFLDNNGIQGISFLSFDYASSQPFGKKTWADVDSFKKAIARCKEHEEFARRVEVTEVQNEEPTKSEPQKANEIKEVVNEGDYLYGYEDVVVDLEDPFEQNLLLLDPKKEARIAELQEKPKCELTEKEDFDLNELMAEKIANTRSLRNKEARMDKKKQVEWEADGLMTNDILKVSLKNKLSDGQLKLILRTHTQDDEVQLEHPFGLVTSSQADIDAYYKRYNINEKKYPKARC